MYGMKSTTCDAGMSVDGRSAASIALDMQRCRSMRPGPNLTRALLSLGAIALGACTGGRERTAAAPACGVTDSTHVTGGGIGDLRVGAPADSLGRSCRVLRDTTLASGNEGMPERRVAVLLGADTVEATVVDDMVWRIEIRTP